MAAKKVKGKGEEEKKARDVELSVLKEAVKGSFGRALEEFRCHVHQSWSDIAADTLETILRRAFDTAPGGTRTEMTAELWHLVGQLDA